MNSSPTIEVELGAERRTRDNTLLVVDNYTSRSVSCFFFTRDLYQSEQSAKDVAFFKPRLVICGFYNVYWYFVYIEAVA